MSNEPLSVGEFERAMRMQTKIFLGGIGEITSRLDKHGDRLSAVETRLDERTTRASTKSKVGWSTIAAGVSVVAAKVAEKLWTK